MRTSMLVALGLTRRLCLIKRVRPVQTAAKLPIAAFLARDSATRKHRLLEAARAHAAYSAT